MRAWQWMKELRWYLLLGVTALVETVLDTYGLLTEGYRPDHWIPYVYTLVLVGCLAVYHWRVQLRRFIETEFAPRATDRDVPHD